MRWYFCGGPDLLVDTGNRERLEAIDEPDDQPQASLRALSWSTRLRPSPSHRCFLKVKLGRSQVGSVHSMRIFVATVAVPALRRFDHPRSEKLPATVPMLRLVVASQTGRPSGGSFRVSAASRPEARLRSSPSDRLELSSMDESKNAMLPGTPSAILPIPVAATPSLAQQPYSAVTPASPPRSGRAAPYAFGYAPGTVFSSDERPERQYSGFDLRATAKLPSYSAASVGRRVTPSVSRHDRSAAGTDDTMEDSPVERRDCGKLWWSVGECSICVTLRLSAQM